MAVWTRLQLLMYMLEGGLNFPHVYVYEMMFEGQ